MQTIKIALEGEKINDLKRSMDDTARQCEKLQEKVNIFLSTKLSATVPEGYSSGDRVEMGFGSDSRDAFQKSLDSLCACVSELRQMISEIHNFTVEIQVPEELRDMDELTVKLAPERLFEHGVSKPWDRLLEYVSANTSRFTMEQYERDLVKRYPNEVLQIYVNDLKRSAKQAHSRDTYSRWAETLQHMKTIKGGTAVVTELLAEWRQIYKNRPAMMQELQGVDAKLKPAPKRKLK